MVAIYWLLFGFITSLYLSLTDVGHNLFLWVVEEVGLAVVSVVAVIPLPDWFVNGCADCWAGISGVWCLLGWCGAPTALAIIASAYMLKFFLAVVPFSPWKLGG